MDRILNFLKKVIPRRIFLFFEPYYHWSLAFLSAFYYGFPSRRLKVIGVVGTNGKSTVVEMLHYIFSSVGFRTASVSSLRFKMLGEEKKNFSKMTMPGRFFLQKFLHDAIKNKVDYVFIETTSEGIKQFRHKFIKFDVGALTNVTPEHIESHGGFENYVKAKLSFFEALSPSSTAILNEDDGLFSRFVSSISAKKIFYSKRGIFGVNPNLAVKELNLGVGRTSFLLGSFKIESDLLGEFNFYNTLTAIAVAVSQGIGLSEVANVISRFKGAPGRLEFVPAFVPPSPMATDGHGKTSAGEQKELFRVVVDYAHTPDALKKVYETLKMIGGSGRLICVLGAAGGGRDKWKRPELGRIAAEFCREIILTNEDPYDENPAEILEQISAGFSQILNSKPPHQYIGVGDKPQILNLRKIIDRREAIREAVKSAQAGDTVVITGKGAEPWIMGPRNTKTPWDDRVVVKEELQLLTTGVTS